MGSESEREEPSSGSPLAVPSGQAFAERSLELVFGKVPGAVWATDRELRITFLLGHIPGLAGLQPSRLVGTPLQGLLGTEDPADPALTHHFAALGGQSGSFRYPLCGHMCEARVDPLRDVNGDIVGCLGVIVDVTERTRIEQELSRSERRLTEVQRLARIGCWDWDVPSDTVVWTDELYRIYGLAPGDFRGTFEAFMERVHPEDAERTKTMAFDALRITGPFVYDHRIVRPDGSVRMLQTRGEVVTDERGRAARVMAACWDVTERWEADKALAHSMSLLRATLDSTAEGILVVDVSGKITIHNKRFLVLWGLSTELAEGGDDDALLSAAVSQLEDPEAFQRRVTELYAQPLSESFDILHFKDGRVFERSSSPQRLGSEIVGRVWSFRNVTERETLLRHVGFLADASRLLSSLDAEKALEGVAHLAVRSISEGCAIDLLSEEGGPRRLLSIYRNPVRSIPPKLPRAVLSGASVIYALDAISYLSVPLLARGTLLGVLTLAAAEGRHYGHTELTLAEELSRRMALAFDNARLYRKAQEALRTRDEFLSVAAHEVRGPITSIHLAAQGLERGQIAGPGWRRAIEIVDREAERLAQLVDELLDVSRFNTGRLQFQLEQVDLVDVTRDAAGRLAGELGRSGSSLSITVEGGGVQGLWDRSRLEQVVMNLLSNAIKFGLSKPIRVSVIARDGWAILTIEDQGIGIPIEAQTRIFSPFERAVSDHHYGGLGLGLYIVRTIVEGLGGRVRVESQVGAGATLTVELPMPELP